MLFAKRSFPAPPRELAARLRSLVAAEDADVERTREWLAFAGQIEQAVADACDPGGPELAFARPVTDAAAETFLDARADGEAGRQNLLAALAAARLPEAPAAVRIPEGFAWYALFPESHAGAAEAWAARAAPGVTVLVIGLLSIGTSLGAVVAAALRRCGVRVLGRLSLRPGGPAFDRRTVLPGALPRADAVIVVDEGPGLSGSSMAGVADALQARGVAPAAISFFPGHAQGPGPEADERIRLWWAPARCFTGPAPRVVRPEPGVDWIFGGFAAVTARLETLAAVKRARQCRLAAAGLALPSPAGRDGWIALARHGTAMREEDLSPGFVEKTLAPYVAGAALAGEEAAIGAGVERIEAALAHHGVAAGTAAALLPACRSLPLAGDGRLGPGEWRRLADGRVLKHNATGSDCEHDWAGPQCLLWDVAGAMVEWRMGAAERARWLDILQDCHGIATTPRALAFHAAGYAALQLARARHGGDTARADNCAGQLREALAWLG